MKYNAMVGQSGGPTAAINATLAGVIRGAFANDEIDKIYGLQHGAEGLINKKFTLLNDVFKTDEDLTLLELTPAAALGSCRLKLPKYEEKPETYTDIFATLAEMNVKYFFYIGGNDSMDMVHKLSSYAAKVNSDIRFVGVPKTVDNDLMGTDHTPGYGSAAKYVATTLQEIVRDCAVYTTKAVTIVEVMGRDAGWLTASAALPRLIGTGAPDLVYMPEVDFNLEEFYEDVEKEFAIKPNLTIAVCEGIRFADGTYVGEGAQSGVRDTFGHKYLSGTAKYLTELVKEKFGCKVRAVDLNLPQRCAAHIGSLTDIEESVALGKSAVGFAVSGKTGITMAYKRISTEPYKIEIGCEDVANVANKVYEVPRKFINERGNNVTDECLKHIAPLIQGETKVVYEKGMPVHFVIPK
ncbi:MAG: 6-phosphofructokinase [Oscillospiraceae bacterium]|nr:6-phosphofructokinase [Oscillospiraceae bacterium]